MALWHLHQSQLTYGIYELYDIKLVETYKSVIRILTVYLLIPVII